MMKLTPTNFKVVFSVWASVLYPLFTAISALYIEKINVHMRPALSLFICVSLATIYFNLINYPHLKKMYQNAIKNWKASLKINAIILVSWVCTFYSLYFIDPYTYVMIFYVIPAGIVNAQNFVKTKNFIELLSFFLLLAIIGYYCYDTMIHTSTKQIVFILGVSLSILGGTSLYFYQVVSQNYVKIFDNKATQVLSVRSYGLIAASAVLMFALPHSEPISSSLLHLTEPSIWLNLALIVIFSFIVPLYFNQKGMQASGYIIHSCLAATCPVMMFFLAYATGSIADHSHYLKIFILSLLVSVILVTPMLYRFIKSGGKL